PLCASADWRERRGPACFFFQGEDGIRDRNVTGVQTCALPIYLGGVFTAGCIALSLNAGAYMAEIVRGGIEAVDKGQMEAARSLEIGRASCRERGQIADIATREEEPR